MINEILIIILRDFKQLLFIKFKFKLNKIFRCNFMKFNSIVVMKFLYLIAFNNIYEQIFS